MSCPIQKLQLEISVCVPEYDQLKYRTNETFTIDPPEYPSLFTYVTYAGLTVSIISIVSHLVVFGLVSSARNLSGCCLASLSVSQLMAYVCFLAGAHVDAASCADLGMCIYYFFLTSYFWRNAIAFDVWRSFRSVMRELRISSHRFPWTRLLLYSLYSWAVPGFLAVVVKFLDSFGEGRCWFESCRAHFSFFAVPLVVVMVLNAAFFLHLAFVISRAGLKKSHEATFRKKSVMRELRISSHRFPWTRLLLYSLYALAIPVLLVVVVKFLDVVPGFFKSLFEDGHCWFGSRRALLVFFALPLVVGTVLNAAFFLNLACAISRAALKSSHEATLMKSVSGTFFPSVSGSRSTSRPLIMDRDPGTSIGTV